MPVHRSQTVDITPDLRLTAGQDVTLTPGEALQLAERITLAAMMRQAALLPARQLRRPARMAFDRKGLNQ